MKSHSILLPSLHLVIVFLIFGLGLFFLCLPWTPQFRSFLVQMILYQPMVFFLFGLGLVIVASLVTLGFWGSSRSSFLRVKMNPFPCTIDKSIIETSLQKYWNRIFPGQEIHTEVVITERKRLELIVYLSPLGVEEQRVLLERSEREIGELLRDHFDYHKGFVVTLCYR